MLTYDMLKFEKGFAFQITYQSPKVREYLAQLGGTYRAFNGWKVKSVNCPEIHVEDRTVYVRGNDSSMDLRVERVHYLSSDFQRNLIAGAVNSALQEFIGRMNSVEIVAGYVAPAAGVAVELTESSKPSVSGNDPSFDKPVISA